MSAESIDHQGFELRLDVQPGPEVRVVRDADDDVWFREGSGDRWTVEPNGSAPRSKWTDGPAWYGPVVDVTRESASWPK